jgi:hypothetical protein
MAFKKCKVVMLPAFNQTHQVEKGDTFIDDSRRYSWGKLQVLICERVTEFGHAWSGGLIQTYINHLYILSDDSIRVGDWFIHDNNVYQLKGISPSDGNDFNSVCGKWLDSNECNKIVATTDKSLRIRMTGCTIETKILPQLSNKSIKSLIDYHIKNNKMPDEVRIKEDYLRCNGDLKLLSGDGEDGEGMTKPFYCKCVKCKEKSFYSVEQSNIGCDMIISDHKHIKLNSQGEVDITITEENVFSEKDIILYSYWLRETSFNVHGHSPEDCVDEWVSKIYKPK